MLQQRWNFFFGGLFLVVALGGSLGILFGLKPYQSQFPFIPTESYFASTCTDPTNTKCQVNGTLNAGQVALFPFFSWDKYNISFYLLDDYNELCVNQDNISGCVDIYDAHFTFCCVSVMGIRAVDPTATNVSYEVTFHTVDDGLSATCHCALTPTAAWIGFAFILIIFGFVSAVFCVCACCQKKDGFIKLVESKNDVRLPTWSDDTGWTFPEKKSKCTIL